MTTAIETRYAPLAGEGGSLSCGGALKHVDARPGQVCLDLGSGRGGDVLALARRVGPTGLALGADLTQAMIDHARARAAAEGLPQARFVRCELSALEVESGSVDWVVSNCALNHASDKARVWREIARVLKPGGRFVVSDIYAVGEISEADRHDPAAVAECWAGAEPRGQTLAHVAAAGLEELEVVEESAPYEKARTTVASFTVTGRRPVRVASGQPATRTEGPPAKERSFGGHGGPANEGEVRR